MALSSLDKLTESEWKKAKTDAGIPSSGVFAKADQKNNIGPSIAAYQRADAKLKREETTSSVSAYIKALEALEKAIDKLVGSEGVKGNRELTSPKAKTLGADLEKLRDEVATKSKDYLADFKKRGGLKALEERENKLRLDNLTGVRGELKGERRSK